jgi:hypothetical protein
MLSVATAGASGPIGNFKEAFAPALAVIEAAKGSNELLKSICDREELKAVEKSLCKSIDSIEIGGDLDMWRDTLQTMAADKAREAIAILKQEGSAEDMEAFRTLLVDIADRTAEAAKEGGFLGIGGERVSEVERTAISRISRALELQPS